MAATKLVKLRTYASDLEEERKKISRGTTTATVPSKPLTAPASVTTTTPIPSTAPKKEEIPLAKAAPITKPRAIKTIDTSVKKSPVANTPAPVVHESVPAAVPKNNPLPKKDASAPPRVVSLPTTTPVNVASTTPDPSEEKKESKEIKKISPEKKPNATPITATIHKANPDSKTPTRITTNTNREVRDSNYPATVIRDTKHKRFSLSREISNGLRDWWHALKISRTKQNDPVFTAPPLSRQRGVVQSAVSGDATSMAEHEAVVARLKKVATFTPEKTDSTPVATTYPIPEPIPDFIPSWGTAIPEQKHQQTESESQPIHEKVASILPPPPKPVPVIPAPTRTVPTVVTRVKNEPIVPPLIPSHTATPEHETPAPIEQNNIPIISPQSSDQRPEPDVVKETHPITPEEKEYHAVVDELPPSVPLTDITTKEVSEPITPIHPTPTWNDSKAHTIDISLAEEMGTFYEGTPKKHIEPTFPEVVSMNLDNQIISEPTPITPTYTPEETSQDSNSYSTLEEIDALEAELEKLTPEPELYESDSYEELPQPHEIDIPTVSSTREEEVVTPIAQPILQTPTPITPFVVVPTRIEPRIPTIAERSNVTSVPTTPAPVRDSLVPQSNPPLPVTTEPETPPPSLPVVPSTKPRRNFTNSQTWSRILKGATIVIILGSVSVIGYVISRTADFSFSWPFSSTPNTVAVSGKYITGATSRTVVPTLITKDNIIRQISATKASGDVVSEITLLTTYGGELIEGRTVAELLDFSLPTAHRANINDIVFGYYHDDPWLAISFSDSTAARGAMLKWEETIAKDLAPFFPVTKIGKSQFIDDSVANTDVRILKNDAENTMVVYGLLYPNVILITTNDTAFLNLEVNKR